jgi:hypothetical protein
MMVQPEESQPTRSPSRHRARPSRARRVLAFLSEWRAEILVVFLVALAIFLLVERMQIRQTLLGSLRQGLQALRSLGGGAGRWVVNFVERTTLSDLTGYTLLLIAVAFVAWRTRWRLMRMPRFTAAVCPHCGSDLRRVHRRPRDRLLDLFVPVRRYRCKNRDCYWSGLRVKRSRHE